MTSTPVLTLSADHAQPPTDRVLVELLMPESTSCVPCQHAIEEIDDAAALLALELAARGTAVLVRVTTRPDPATHGTGPLPALRVNGVAIDPDRIQDCLRDGGDGDVRACGTYDWDGAAYAVPPAELLAAVIHDHVDRNP